MRVSVGGVKKMPGGRGEAGGGGGGGGVGGDLFVCLLVQVVLLTCLNVSALSSLVYMVTAPRSSAPVGTVRLVPSGATGQAEGIARNTCRQS